MRQCGRVECLARSLVGQLLGSEKTEFFIGQRQEFVCSLRVLPFNRV